MKIDIKSAAVEPIHARFDEKSAPGGRAIFWPLLAALLVSAGVLLPACQGEQTDEESGGSTVDCRRENALTNQMLRKSVHLKAGLGLCYTVTEQLTVGTDVTLRIDPGVRVVFADDAGLTVHEGVLSARGTEKEPIIFTARRQEPGAWMGIRFMNSTSSDNALVHATIEYAGATPGFAGVQPANLMLDDYYGKVNLTLSRVTLRHSAGYGFYAEADAQAKFSKNTLTANQKGAAYLSPVFLDQLDTESDFSGNKVDRVLLSGATIESQSLRWPGLKVPYVVTDDLKLTGNAFVEVGAGATFKFAENTGISVFRSRFSARGKKDAPVVFTGINEVPGFWKGILYIDTNSVDNALEHVAIRYAGANPTYKGVEPANLMLDDYFGKVRLKLHNTELSHSGGYGLYAEAKTDLDFGHNKLVENQRAAALLHPAVVSALDKQSVYGAGKPGVATMTGGGPDEASAEETDEAEETDDNALAENAENADNVDSEGDKSLADAPFEDDGRGKVEVLGANLDGVQATWPAIAANYVIRGDILVRDDAHLTLEPGVVLMFSEGAGISVFRARLTARGTAENPILFTGQSHQPGFWKGIHLVDTSSVENAFEHVVIEYGGSPRTFKGAEPANLMFDDYFGLVSATLNDVTSRHSGAAGMHIEPGAKIRSRSCASIKIEAEPQVTAESKSLGRACRG